MAQSARARARGEALVARFLIKTRLAASSLARESPLDESHLRRAVVIKFRRDSFENPTLARTLADLKTLILGIKRIPEPRLECVPLRFLGGKLERENRDGFVETRANIERRDLGRPSKSSAAN